MNQSELPAFVTRATELLVHLAIPEQPILTQLDTFLSGPPTIAIFGTRARGLTELTTGLKREITSVKFLSDIDEEELVTALVDAVIVVTPCEAALSAREIEQVFALRGLKRPVCVVVVDSEQLGDARATGEEEIEAHRLRPLLSPLDVEWYFRASGDPFDAEQKWVARTIEPGVGRLHERPASDALVRILIEAEATYSERCLVRDRERDILRGAEAQGPLDITLFSEFEKVERLRVADRIRSSFERVLVAADATGAALATWVRAGSEGGAKDATSTIDEAWVAFCREIVEAPLASFNAVKAEGRRLDVRLEEVATKLNVTLPPEIPKDELMLPPKELEDAGRRLADTSIRDLIDGAISLMKASASEDSSRSKKTANRVVGAIPLGLTPVEHVRGNLTQGIRSRVDLRLQAYLDGIEDWLKSLAQSRISARERARIEVMAHIRSTISERYAWSSTLGELQMLRHEVEEFRRTHA